MQRYRTDAEPRAGEKIWHRSCLVWHSAAYGKLTGLESDPLAPNRECICGRAGAEPDHWLAVSNSVSNPEGA